MVKRWGERPLYRDREKDDERKMMRDRDRERPLYRDREKDDERKMMRDRDRERPLYRDREKDDERKREREIKKEVCKEKETCGERGVEKERERIVRQERERQARRDSRFQQQLQAGELILRCAEWSSVGLLLDWPGNTHHNTYLGLLGV